MAAPNDDVPPPLERVSSRQQHLSASKQGADSLIGLRADDSKLHKLIAELQSRVAPQQAQSTLAPQIKSYSDIVYLNYHAIGASCQLQPEQGYRPPSTAVSLADLDLERLSVCAVDIYNHEAKHNQLDAKKKRPAAHAEYAAWPAYPVSITCPAREGDQQPTTLDVLPQTVGRDFVETLGEPDRKGGGEGSIGIWAEWTNLGVLAEFASSGLKAWDHGAQAQWTVLTLFRKGEARGQDTDE
ncbi:hypothetical protein OIV83_006272 [Microbotryomycetes sp. JL201]|nr:hypothetical protein OIV83_006272 [Microbotryomycetes sp. JL201]